MPELNGLKDQLSYDAGRYPTSVFGSLLNRYYSILFIDTETTGFNAETDHITEFAAIKINREGAEEEFTTFVKLPEGTTVPEKIIAITGITDEMCNSGIPGGELYHRLISLMEGKTLLVAYNLQFDASFLLALSPDRTDETALLPNKKLDYLDALTVYRDRAEAPHKLSDAIQHYNVSGKNSHRAIEDAMGLMEVTKAMAAEKDDLLSYINRFGYKAKYGISGKHIDGIKYFEQL